MFFLRRSRGYRLFQISGEYLGYTPLGITDLLFIYINSQLVKK